MLTLSQKGTAMATDAAPLELEPASPEVKRYSRLKITISAVNAVLSIGWLALLAVVAGPQLSHDTAAWEGWARLLASAALLGVTLELLTFPLDYYSGFVLEHRFQLSNQTFAGWMCKRLKGYAVGGTLGLVLIFGLYWILWVAGEWWWLVATVGWLAVTLVLGRLLPVVILPIFYKFDRLDDESLLMRLRNLCAGTGLAVEGIYRLHLSEETRKANAALAALGKT